ncbi:hypothetical protein M405DRAFT_884198 [Rhizopogon salebrosus TDB-379]|nr:hypothetical protein M405DRAFT_884198 [Rhizopogon salebrosus TDB-379]
MPVRTSTPVEQAPRERVLAPTERPAAIVIRRLQQAGYDQVDSLAFLGAEDMTFLIKFVEELTFDEFEIIDLTGCSLPTIPIVLHQNASSIVYLNLLRNPMVEIPLDFIQSCDPPRSKVIQHGDEESAAGRSSYPYPSEETDERRVHTSQTEVNGTDTRSRRTRVRREDEALSAMFGLAQASPGNNVLSKYLHDNFASFLNEQLPQLKKPDQMGEQKEGVPDALRRTFLKINRQLHDKLYAPSRKMSQVSGTTAHPQFDSNHRQGASGIVMYVVCRTLYVANVGRALAVISSRAIAELISKKHDP